MKQNHRRFRDSRLSWTERDEWEYKKLPFVVLRGWAGVAMAVAIAFASWYVLGYLAWLLIVLLYGVRI
jgi:hypothetical protein